MKLSALFAGLGIRPRGGDPEISGLDYDSRRIQPGWLFVAMRGESSDGNRYIEAAIAKGAKAVATDSPSQAVREGIAWAVVPHGRKALAQLSANYYHRPAEKLKIVGVTGTNGKTTTTFLIESILNFCRKRSALVGTIEYHVAGQVLPAPHTTPESLELNQILARAVDAGATDAAMEVSSHALEQGRVWAIPYEVAVFTNLTRDHLDYHKDMEAYFAAKKLLFQGTGAPAPRTAVINADDPYGQLLLKVSHQASQQTVSYGIDKGDFRAANIRLEPTRTRFNLVAPGATVTIESRLIGKINVYNLLSAAAATSARGCSLDQIREAVSGFNQVPGRFERVDCGQPFTVVVDYAHTDDALRNLTSIARDFVSGCGKDGRVITVFGCGGDRDRTKRPLMGEAAGRGSDFVVVTSDNPRSEDPQAIIGDIVPGLQRSGNSNYSIQAERQKAIAVAIAEARPGDMVLIAGKGHEKTQTTREGVFPFDDVQVVRNALKQLLSAGQGGGKQ